MALQTYTIWNVKILICKIQQIILSANSTLSVQACDLVGYSHGNLKILPLKNKAGLLVNNC